MKMATSGGSPFDNLLSQEEIELIPENIYTKIKAYVEENFEEYLTSKALFESSKVKHGKILLSLCRIPRTKVRKFLPTYSLPKL